ncbi:MAG: DUF459 domain-containing protein [Actinomycetota bacterium]
MRTTHDRPERDDRGTSSPARRPTGAGTDPTDPTDTTAPSSGGRRLVPAGRVFVAAAVALLVWLFLDAPALEAAAEASTIGTRRSVALFFLEPIADTTRFLQLDHLRGAVDSAAGRDPTAFGAPDELAAVPEFTGEDDQPKNNAKRNQAVEGDPLPPIEGGTREDPLRMVVVGDSFAQGIAGSLSRGTLRNTVALEARGVLSTGLTRPDYFNWPSSLRPVVSRFQPDVTVVMLGGNDSQTMTTVGSDQGVPLTSTDQWRAAYAERVGQFMDIATSEGGRVVWLGLPTMKDEIRDRQGDRLNDMYRAEADERPGVEYVDTYELFSDANGNYAPFLRDESGDPTAVRADDGEHMTSIGYDWVADDVLEIIEDTWEVQGTIRR